jgi:signal transduction histidine kinase/ligand-binding sensor domain-containing protein
MAHTFRPLRNLLLVGVIASPVLAGCGDAGEAPASGSPRAATQAYHLRPSLPGLDPSRPLTQYGVESWTERQGLPQNFVPALAQTPDGYLWSGSERGLVRFDGVRFRVFTPENSPGLPSAWITSLLADPHDGALWVGTGNGGIARLSAGGFETILSPGEGGTGASSIQGMFRDARGRLWAGTEGSGVLVLSLPEVGSGVWRTEAGASPPGEGPPPPLRVVGAEQGLPNPFVTALVPVWGGLSPEGADGGVWVGTPSGVAHIDGATFEVERPPGLLERTEVTALLHEEDDTLWIGTGGGGVIRMRGGELLPPGPEVGVGNAFVSAILRDRAGALWIGTNGAGLHRLHDGALETLDASVGFPGDLVRSLLEDREGHLWVGQTSAGLVRIQDGIFDWIGSPEGLSMDVALGLGESPDGALWVGTPGEGVNRVLDGEVTTWRTSEGLGSDFVMAVAMAPDGAVWVGTLGGGVSRILDGRVDRFGSEEGLLGPQVSVVHVDRAGALWVGYRGQGIQRWRPGPPVHWDVASGLPSGAVTTVADDGFGRLWVGTRSGLARIEEGGEMRVFGVEEGLPHGHITSIYHDTDGGSWVSTMGGLARIRGDSVTPLGVEAGFPPVEPLAVAEDALGALWMSTSQGILRALRAQLDSVADGHRSEADVRRYDRSYGLRSAEANGGVHRAALVGSDGHVYFPTMAGVVRIDPTRTERARLTPAPVLEMGLVGDRAVPLHTALQVGVEERNLEFTFSAPTFLAPERVRLRYRLEGFDEDWVQAGEDRRARYTNLPPRRYRFVVESGDRDEGWSGSQVSVGLNLVPRFHERRLVRAGGLLLLLLMGFGLYRNRILTLQAREARLLQVVEERARASDALRRSEEQLRFALEAARMGTWEWELETDRVSWTDGAAALLGPTPGSGEGLRRRLVEVAARENLQDLVEALDGIEAGRTAEFGVHFAVRSSESADSAPGLPGGPTADAPGAPPAVARQVELRGRRVEGSSPRVVGVVADVTDLIATREELRAREADLRQIQKMEAVGSLAGGVAHDFNNLLSVIGMNARLAMEGVPEGSSAHEELQETIRAADRAAELTRQLLAFSRKQILRPTRLDLNATVGSVERMLRRLLRANVTLETELAEALHPVVADETGVEQILLNLLVNAQDAMPRGGTVTIRTRNVPADSGAAEAILQSPHVVLSVADTGVGMDESTRNRIFEPFFTTKGVGEGTGLGLASVYGIVQQSGGEVEVWSEPGRGAVFSILFPAAEAAEAAESAEAAAGPAAGAPPPPPGSPADPGRGA